MHPALHTQRVQCHIDDLHRSAAARALRSQAQRAATRPGARRMEMPSVPELSMMRRLVARFAL